MSRIATVFERLKTQKRKALIPFVTAGDPDPSVTVSLMHSLVESGADIIELGVPFSDPMSDGPVIQRASERALKKGVSLKSVLGMVEEFRKQDNETPVVLMGYQNPFEAMGYENFASAAKGVDGVLSVDCPPEEGGKWLEALKKHGIAPIFLLSPTTSSARIEKIAPCCSGYIYYVSLAGVTGAAHIDLVQVAQKLSEIKKKSALPICIGFGIKDAKTAQEAASIADGIVIGSRIVQEIESSESGEVLSKVSGFIKEVRHAIDSEKDAS